MDCLGQINFFPGLSGSGTALAIFYPVFYKDYLKHRFKHFGDYQDAIDTRAPFLYHSIISPLMNIGFLLPGEVVREVIKYQTQENFNSVEGFIRQIIGWREYMRGMYWAFMPEYKSLNELDNQNPLANFFH